MLYQEFIWQQLCDIDVTPYVHADTAKDSKNNPLVYLPWQYAHQLMMAVFPSYSWRFQKTPEGSECFYFKDGTAEVRVILKVGEVEIEASKSVTDFNGDPLVNPNANSIHNAKMRCRVRALAELGLGWELFVNPSKFIAKPDEAKQEGGKKAAKPKAKTTKSASDDAAKNKFFQALMDCESEEKAKAKLPKARHSWVENRKWDEEEFDRRWSELEQERKWK
jgi:hypothetical protein